MYFPCKLRKSFQSNLFAYLLLVFSLFITLRIAYSFLYIDLSDGNYTFTDHLTSCLRSIADSVILTLPYCLLSKRYKPVYFSFLLIISLLLLSCIWYYRNFETVIPYTAFLMPGNLNGLGPSIVASMQARDILVPAPSVAFVFLYYTLLAPRMKSPSFKKRIVFFSLCLAFAVPVQINAGWNDYIGCGGRRIHILKHYGLLHIIRFDLKCHRKCNPGELEEISVYLSRHRNKPERCPQTRKNLILILTESFTSWPIGLRLNREEITPCINRLVHEPGTVYFPHVLPQTNDGRSSDAQLIINTGLLPLRSGAAAMLFGTNEYYSIPKALAHAGYKSYNFICDEPAFWNQGTTSIAYGFDKLFDKTALGSTGRKLNDRELFEATSIQLASLNTPFYAQIVTLSTHHPFGESTCLNHNPAILSAGLPDKEAAYFLAAVQYTDRQIGRFVDHLKKTGLYDKSIIIITGDHEHITYNRFKGVGKTSLSDRYVPLIILNGPGYSGEQDAVIGQSDIYPTILDLMGAGNYAFYGIGTSIFERTDDCAVSRTGEVAGNNRREEVIAGKRLGWKISDLIIRSDYFKSGELKRLNMRPIVNAKKNDRRP